MRHAAQAMSAIINAAWGMSSPFYCICAALHMEQGERNDDPTGMRDETAATVRYIEGSQWLHPGDCITKEEKEEERERERGTTFHIYLLMSSTRNLTFSHTFYLALLPINCLEGFHGRGGLPSRRSHDSSSTDAEHTCILGTVTPSPKNECGGRYIYIYIDSHRGRCCIHFFSI